MVRFRFLLVLGLLCLPAIAQAKGFGHGSSGSHSSGGHGSSNVHGSAPVNAPRSSGGYYYRGGYYAGRYYSPGYYQGYGGPYWWGWGIHPWGYYGYGYYPYYGGPAVVDEVGPTPPTTTSGIFLGGLFARQGAGLNLKAAVDGRDWGVNFSMLTLPSINPNDATDVTVMPLLAGHLTYSIVSNLHARIRAEGGIAGVGAPGVTYIGPDVGASAQLAVAGPLAIYGAAHWMPVPASIIDLDAGVGLNFGALGVQGGWRWVRLDDSNKCTDVGESCGTDIFNGPQISVGVLF